MIYVLVSVVIVLLVIAIALMMSVITTLSEQKTNFHNGKDQLSSQIGNILARIEGSERRVTTQVLASENRNTEVIRDLVREFKEKEVLEITNSLRTLLKRTELINEPKVVPQIIPVGFSGQSGTSGTSGSPIIPIEVPEVVAEVYVKETDNVLAQIVDIKHEDAAKQDNECPIKLVEVTDEEVLYNIDYYDGGHYVVKTTKNKALHECYEAKFVPELKVPNVEDFTNWYQDYFEKNFDGSDLSFDSLKLEDYV